MCGIAGFVHHDGRPADAGVAERMIAMLHHRGPDGSGLLVRGQAVLAHARLSIIDLSGGAQPMSNEDGTLWVSFNGEIYNYLELRADLEARGHQFKTRSDTEVIVHAYEEFGPACLDVFNGQFAIAIWNTVDGSLFLARDRFGKKPLYYATPDNLFVFASEMKAVLTHPEVKRDLGSARSGPGADLLVHGAAADDFRRGFRASPRALAEAATRGRLGAALLVPDVR